MQKNILCFKKTKKSLTKETKPIFDYRVLKYVGLLVLMWPLDKNAKWHYRLLYEMCWWIFFINEIFLFLGISIGLYHSLDKIPSFTTVIFILYELTVICEIIFTVILFKVRDPQIKILITILESIVNNVKSKEEVLFKEYVKQSNLVTCMRFAIYQYLFILYIYLQLFKPTLILPKEVWHPFSIDPFNKYCLVLMQQAAYIFRAGLLNIADGLVSMSLNAATVKLKVLSDKLRNVITNFELKTCIREHQDIIWYVKEINTTMRYIILKGVISTAFYLIYAFLQVIHVHETLHFPLTLYFIIVACLAHYRMYYTAACADDLMSMGENLKFSLQWAGKSRKMSRSMCIIIQRCQKPLCISVSGVIPKFSLEYYGTFSYFTFSYFLTLKAILELKTRFQIF